MADLGTLVMEEQRLDVTRIDLHDGQFRIHAAGTIHVHLASGNYVCALFDPQGREVAVNRHTLNLGERGGHPGDRIDFTWHLHIDHIQGWGQRD